MDMEFRTFKLRRDPACPVCGDHPTITEPIDYEQFCGVPDPRPQESSRRPSAEVHDAKSSATARPAAQARPVARRAGCRRATQFKPDWEVTPREVKAMLDQGEKFVFIDCRLPNE